MRTLANCKPREFLTQTVRIKSVAEKWIKNTDIMNIRRTMPDIPKDAKEEEIAEIKYRQGLENLSKMVDAMFEKCPEDTLELLALMCFIEPSDVDNYPISYYLAAMSELLNDRSVLGFFTSLVRLGQKNT